MMHALQNCLLLCLLTCLGHDALGSEIIHGKEVPENSMQFMASLQNAAGDHVCGGFLIRKDFVLTAAHCKKKNATSVVLGTHNLKKVDNKTMRFEIRECKHGYYNSVETGNDIMLLKLLKKPRLGKGVKLVPIPKSTIKLKDNTKCTVAGWGSTKSFGPNVNVLQEVGVNVVNLKICQEKWKKDIPKLPANVLCAGGYETKNGFCQGDSGGPLVCNGKAVGIVSFNKYKNCNYPNVPNIYTDVSKYLDWIKKILKQRKC
ncbi:granzyme B(G,H)-like [Halichoeres trimaculatus]|uniref:granzyme B(G,H)-like n=1 Tax=Halichoeres trimaculatus TaxID=147232 RepID=UPI003D9DFEAD